MLSKQVRLTFLVSTFIVITLFALANVSALGISPAKKTIRFTPGEPQTLTYFVINNEHRDLNLKIYAIGILANYTVIDTPELSVSSVEESRQFRATITLPPDLPPGENVGKIVVEELLAERVEGETRVWAKLKVVTKVYVNVPYPEKFIDVDLEINDTEVGQPLSIVAVIKNLGTTDIDELKAEFAIYEAERKLESKSSETVSLARNEITRLFTSLNTSDFNPGRYSAITRIEYDQNILELGRDFKIGDVYIEILDYTRYFLVEAVNSFDIEAISRWNRKIRNAYAKIGIANESATIANLRSVSYDLDPREKKIITAYWDTSGVSLGDYEANMSLLYENRSTTETGTISVVSPAEYERLQRPGFPWLTLVLVALALIALNIALLLLRKKKLRKRRLKR